MNKHMSELSQTDLSISAQKQIRELMRERGGDFERVIQKWFDGKKDARAYKKKCILDARKDNPNALPGNKEKY